MDLNWEAIGAIGEIVGAIAVVATLAYLARETRTNTKAVVSASQRTSSWGHADWNADSAKDPVLASLLYRSTQQSMAEFDDYEWFRFQLIARSVVLRIQDSYLQRRLGFFDHEIAESQLNHLRSLIEYPAWKLFWEDEIHGGNYPQAFVEEIASRQPMHIGMTALRDLVTTTGPVR